MAQSRIIAPGYEHLLMCIGKGNCACRGQRAIQRIDLPQIQDGRFRDAHEACGQDLLELIQASRGAVHLCSGMGMDLSAIGLKEEHGGKLHKILGILFEKADFFLHAASACGSLLRSVVRSG